MMSPYKILAVLASAAALMCACSGKNAAAPTSPNAAFAAEKGREAAIEAARMQPGSMQQEKALLQIRAMEHRIRQAGDTLAADAYINAAEAALDSLGVL